VLSPHSGLLSTSRSGVKNERWNKASLGYHSGMLADGGSSGEQPGESLWQRVRSSWEIQEVVAVGVLIAVAILIVSGLASGIAVASTYGEQLIVNSGGNQTWGLFLLYSTRWIGVDVTLFLVAVLGLVWWQVDGWADRLAELEDAVDEVDASDEAEVVAGVAHIVRNKSIATWTGVFLVVSVVAAIGSVVGMVLQYSPGSDALSWGQYFLTGGEALASLVLVAIGGFAYVSLRRRCALILRVSDEAPEVS